MQISHRIPGPAAACAALALWTPAVGQGGVDVQVNADPPGTVQNEVVLALNVANTQNLVMAFNDRVGSAPPTPIGVSTSQDGGGTWTDQQLSVPPNPFGPGSLDVIFDPFLAWGPPSEFYAGYIATVNALSPQSGIFIERSDDGGVTWSGPTTIAIDPAAVGPVDPGYRFNDRPHIDSAAHAFVAVTWIKDVGVNLPTSDVYFTYSNPPFGPINSPPSPPTNLLFTAPVTVNDMPNGTDMANAPHVATHPGGVAYVAWIDFNVLLSDPATGTIKIDSTMLPTGMPVFGPDVTVATIDPLPRNLSTTLGLWDGARAGSYPSIQIDDNDGTGQTIYMAYAADPPGPDEGDIFFIRSFDGGASWSPPLCLNDDGTQNDQMHPNLVEFPGNDLWVAWYDKRNSATDSAWDVYVARSTDGGASFGPNTFVSDATFASPTNTGGSPWLGEYLGLDTDGTDALLGFTKSSNDARGDVFFDRLPGSQAPTVNYCTAGVSASGCQALLSVSGVPSASLPSGFTLQAAGAEGNKNGIFFFGLNGRQANAWGNGSSFQCVVPPVRRAGQLAGTGTNGACDGAFAQDLNALWCPVCPKPQKNPGAGTVTQAQLWYRDPLNTSNQTTSLSDAVQFAICP